MNISRRGRHAQASVALVTGLIALPVVTTPGHDGPARSAKVPGLAISISDGQVSARPGQMLTYTASLRNTGTASIPRLTVTEMLPAGLKITAASDNAAVQAAQVAWSSALPAGGTRTFRVTARVTKPPAQLLRLAAVACVTLPGSQQPVVCAAHLDRLPAIDAAPAARRPGLAESLLLAAAALALLACCAAALLFVWRARLKRRRPFHAATK